MDIINLTAENTSAQTNHRIQQPTPATVRDLIPWNLLIFAKKLKGFDMILNDISQPKPPAQDGWMGGDGIKLSAFGNWLKHLRIAINYKTRQSTASQSHIVGDGTREESVTVTHPNPMGFPSPSLWLWGGFNGRMVGWIEECIIRSCYYSLLSATSESWRHSLPSYREFIMSQFDFRVAEESVEVVCELINLIWKE